MSSKKRIKPNRNPLIFQVLCWKVAAVANSTRCFWNKVDEMDGKAALHIEAIAMPVEWII